MPSKSDLPPLLVRADASTAQGTGHVLRSLALVEAWRARGGSVQFVSCCPAPTMRQRIEAAGAKLIEIEKSHPERSDGERMLSTIEQLQRTHGVSPWAVIDGYHFDAAYQSALRASSARLLVVDDNAHLPHYEADILLNHGIHAPLLGYRCNSDARLLLGSQYALIRPEFLRCRAVRPVHETARNVLVTLGGSDPVNASGKIIQALVGLEAPDLRARIIVGPMNPHLDSLRQMARSADGRISIDTTVADMSALMLWADIAIAGAGGTCWELAFLGVPMLNVIVADNQQTVAAQLEQAQISVNLGWHADVTPSRVVSKLAPLLDAPTVRAAMSARGQALIDGGGADRIIAAITTARLLRAPASKDHEHGASDDSRNANNQRGKLCSNSIN